MHDTASGEKTNKLLDRLRIPRQLVPHSKRVQDRRVEAGKTRCRPTHAFLRGSITAVVWTYAIEIFWLVTLRGKRGKSMLLV